jgi:hypothetical protein
MRPVVFLLPFLACAGPPAPDVELCHDVITRLCLGPVCDVAKSALTVDETTCEETLTTRTGCGLDGFAFKVPSRERFLECRQPLVRTSTSRLTKPGCDEVGEALSTCPDLVLFLKGAK